MDQLTPTELRSDRLSEADRAACHESIRTGSKSFFAASLMLPSETRFAARALYAFCRHSDDMVDESNSGKVACAELDRRLERIYSGEPSGLLADRAFAHVVSRYNIPKAIPAALIEGFRWDETGRTYRTFEEVLDYAARVASTVGVMMTLIMGRRDKFVLARAAELGLAMQLTNIARDIGEDARNGRLYLPLDWLAEAGIDPAAFLKNPGYSPEIAMLTERLLKHADGHYRTALTGVSGLPVTCRTAIRAAALIYREIGREIERNGYDSVTRRAYTSRNRKLTLMSAACLPALVEQPVSRTEPHASAAFLVEAASDPTISQDETGISRFIALLAAAQHRHVVRTARARRSLSRA